MQLESLPPRQRLAVRLRDLLVDDKVGGFAPVVVEGVSAAGLLMNPTQAVADAALDQAMRLAHQQDALLLVHFLGHGMGYQADPAEQARHLLHVWDTVAEPTDTEPESRGWDPYALISRRRPYCSSMMGLILTVDACNAAWAKPKVDEWGGVRGGLVSAWIAASGDHAAWGACLTKTLVDLLERGLEADQHPRRVLTPELTATDLELVAETRCIHQTPRLGGYQSHNPVLSVGRNRSADVLAEELGLDEGTRTLLLGLTADYVDVALEPLMEAIVASRVVGLVGGPGSGKSTIAAALKYPPSFKANVPVGLVQAATFVSAVSSLPGMADVLHRQLTRLPGFTVAAERYRSENTMRWNTLDPWERLIAGPLSIFKQPVRLLIDGLDQIADRPDHGAVLQRLTDLTDAPMLRHVSVLFTGRQAPDLTGIVVLAVPDLDEHAAVAYLRRRQVPDGQHPRLIEMSAGNWLVLKLVADLETSGSTSAATHRDDLYEALLDEVRGRHGAVDPLLAVLAAAGAGPVLPFDLLTAAIGLIAATTVSPADVNAILGDPDLYRMIDRSRPGNPTERIGLFHETLVTHLRQQPRLGIIEAHGAIVRAIEERAAASRHDPKDYRDNPLLAYGFDAGPRHRWEARQAESLVTDLAARTDPVPRVNLARWITWAELVQAVLGPDHPDTLGVRYNLARWTGETGDPAAARDLSAALLPDCERVLGPDHPDTLRVRENLARWTGVAGDPAAARDLSAALLPDCERVLGPDHPDTLRVRRGLALRTGEAGDPAAARDLNAALLPDCERVLGPDHPDTLRARNNLANSTEEAGDPAAARDLSAALVPDFERVLGPDHPDTLRARYNLALRTGDAGDPAAARDLNAALVPDFERVLGPDHPDTLRARQNLANSTGVAGDPAAARDLNAALLPDCARVLGPDHPDTLRVRENLAYYTDEAGDPAAARDLSAALMPDFERVLGPDHPDTLRVRENLAYYTGQADRSQS